MYSTRKTPRIYTTSKQSLDSLPLVELGQDYKELKNLVYSEFKEALALEIQAAKARYIREWNATHEESYEGSFEELNLESNARAKLGGLPDLGSDERVIALLEDFATKFAIKKNAEWFFSQALSKFANLPLAKNEEGLISGKRLFSEHILPDNQLYALYQLFRYPKRSLILDKQTDPKFRNFSSLVPIIMSAFKKFNNVGYEQWDPKDAQMITEPNLAKAMGLGSLPDLTVEEVLQERDAALTVKSGATAGTRRNASTTYTLYFGSGSPLSEIPTLARHMMCQTWCAHPSNRTEFMILNPLKWDNMPEPLVTGDVTLRPLGSVTTTEWDFN